MKNRIPATIPIAVAMLALAAGWAGTGVAGRARGGELAPAGVRGGASVPVSSSTEDAPWLFHTDGLGSLISVDEELRVTLINPGTNAQLYQSGITLEGGVEYKLTFDASSSRGQNVVVAVRQHGAPYTSYGLFVNVDLGLTEDTHELVFTTTPGDKADARLQFYFTPFDGPGDWYLFEDVSLKKADDEGDDDEEDDGESFDEADLYFELNHTDGDLGLHGLIDGDPWTELEIETPGESEDLEIELSGSLGQHGLTELFFESAEPAFDELSPEEFFARFPEGEYEVEGTTLEGEELESEDTLVHLLPAPAGNVAVNGMPLPENCSAEPLPVVQPPLTVTWDPVTLSHPDLGRTNEPITVVRYELIVEREDPELVMSFRLPPDVTAVELPGGLFGGGGTFKIEVLVREESGNQTAVESCVEVE